MRPSLPAASAVFSAILLTAGVAQAAPSVTATHALEKLKPSDPPPPQASAHIAAAANEFESFQAVIAGGEGGVRILSAAMSPLEGPSTIPAESALIYRQAYIDIRVPSDDNGVTGLTPDALIPDVDPYLGEKRNAFPFDVPAGELRALWVDILVPIGTAPGIYTGSLEIEGEGGFQASLPVELEVFPFELPSEPSYVTAFGLSWNGTCAGHVGEAWCNGDDETFDQLRQLYGMAGLDNRISISKVAGAPVPGSNGDLDFSRYDRVYGPLLDGNAPTRLPGAALATIEVWQRSPQAADFAAWAQHFKDQGWFEKLFDYTCDEPPLTCEWSDIKPRQDQLKAGDPEMKSLITTTVAHLKNHGIYESTDIIVPVVNFVEGKNGDYAGDNSADYRQAKADGKTVWIYSSCMSHGCGHTVSGEYGGDPDLHGWPSLVIDHTALQHRAMPWVAYNFGFTGELYWDSAYSFVTKRDPWTDLYDFTGNGDGTLFYPGRPDKIGGTTHIPVESLRLKVIRDGIEDYEYLAILDAFDPDAAQAAAKRLFPHAWSAGDIEPEELLETRREIARQIASYTAKSGGDIPPSDLRPDDKGYAGGGSGSAASGSSSGGGSGDGGGCSSSAAPLGALGLLALAPLTRLRRRIG